MFMWEYLKMAIPAILIIFMAWSANYSMTIMSGFMSVSEQAVQILMMNIYCAMFQIPFGIQCTATAIIGAKIGSGSIKEAQIYYRAIMTLSFFWNVI